MSAFDDVIEHYGTKGMKWGVRRNKSGGRNVNLQRVSSPPQLQVSPEHAQARQLKLRPLATLSNAELKALNERLNLEQNYSRLNPTAVQRGMKTIKSVVDAVGTTAKLITIYDDNKKAVEVGKRVLAKKPKGG